jgi:hypothetical protein
MPRTKKMTVNPLPLENMKISESSNLAQKSKRGRKSKKENNEQIKEPITKSFENIQLQNDNTNNINCNFEETTNKINENTLIIHEINELIKEDENKINSDEDLDILNTDSCITKPIKKRGRKPKGGKIIQQITQNLKNTETKTNVILHLKCSLKDLHNNLLNDNVDSYNISNKTDLPYEIITNNPISYLLDTQTFNDNFNANTTFDDESSINDCEENYKNDNVTEIWKKIKILEHNLHINNISDKKSACFWCTYDFDNPPIYIPKFFIKNSYHVYGCFCSPECATAHLMQENIDSSSKFERYHLLNHIYSKIYDFKKNIKPAPNPFYMLEKFYGNLSIQEYRSLLKNERLFLVIDKPLTRTLPELHEDNDDFIINNKIIPSNTYQIKRKLQRKNQTKTNILNNKFGLTNH